MCYCTCMLVSECVCLRVCVFPPSVQVNNKLVYTSVGTHENCQICLYLSVHVSVCACVRDCMQVFRPENKNISSQVTALYKTLPHSFYLPPIFLSTTRTFFFFFSLAKSPPHPPHPPPISLSPISFDLITATCCRLPAIVSERTASTNTVPDRPNGHRRRKHTEIRNTLRHTLEHVEAWP